MALANYSVLHLDGLAVVRGSREEVVEYDGTGSETRVGNAVPGCIDEDVNVNLVVCRGFGSSGGVYRLCACYGFVLDEENFAVRISSRVVIGVWERRSGKVLAISHLFGPAVAVPTLWSRDVGKKVRLHR